jgi:hypothetical protein
MSSPNNTSISTKGSAMLDQHEPSSILKFNVGGYVHEIAYSTVKRSGMLLKAAKTSHEGDGELCPYHHHDAIFINRGAEIFSSILNYLRDGKVILPQNVTKEKFVNELEVYEVEDINTNEIDEDMRLDRPCSTVRENIKSLKEHFLLSKIANASMQAFIKNPGTEDFSFVYKIKTKEDKQVYESWSTNAIVKVGAHLNTFGFEVVSEKHKRRRSNHILEIKVLQS